ncbi:unnamed protein product [Peniophora sp. CBMAI 1063]|nr:unnamed protein product [Peniophora sp. CBMAI 1063]
MANEPSTTKGHITGTPDVPSIAQSQSPSSSEPNVVAAANQAYASYNRTWDVAQLKTAVALFQQAVNDAPEPKAYLLGELGHCLHLYHWARGDPNDLQRAIAAFQSALQLVPEGHPDRALCLSNLSASLRRRFGSLGAINDLESAIEMQRRAVTLTPNDHPELSNRLAILGSLQSLRFRRFGELEDIESAISNEQRANELTPDDHPGKATQLNNLASSLCTRFERLDDPADLERAITTQCRAVNLTPNDHPDFAIFLDCLGTLQMLRFRHFGELEDIESAISSQQRANELTADDYPNKAKWLHNLASSLRTRFERLDDPADLERAIKIQSRAVELTPDDEPDLRSRLDGLGSLQLLRFGRFRELEDLESAISNRQRAYELTADDNPDKALRLHNLASSLCTRFEHLDDPADLERAIKMQHRVVELTPKSLPDFPIKLASLGSLQWLRFERFGELEDLESAISIARRANELTADDHPDKAVRLHNLARCLVAYFHQERTTDRFAEALSCYMAAASTPSLRSPAKRLEIAINTVKFLDDNHKYSTSKMLLLAHSRAIDVLSEFVWLGHSMKHRLEESQKLGKFVNSAVCAAVRVNAAIQAVEWLESGRTLIWSQTLSLRSPLHDLEQAYPDLARALSDVHVQLQESICLPSHRDGVLLNEQSSSMTSAGRSRADIQRGVAIEHGKLLLSIRKLEGFEDFMLPKKLPALLPASARFGGPVAFINADHVRCDALILLTDGTVKVVALPDISLQRATDLRSQWLLYLELHDARERGTLRDTPRADHHSEEPISPRRILGRVWRWIVRPILEGLGIYGPKAPSGLLPHVIWCPTGPLTQLPLHAAGDYGEFGPRVYDFVVSSYTPSLSALTRSIDAVANERVAPSVLVVTQADVPGCTPIPGTLVEGERVREVLAQSKYDTSLFTGDEVSKAAVRTALNQHTWLHLACHGTQNAEDPLQSAFALYDGPLSLLDLMNTRSDNAELAFLSACQTAVGDEKMPEESMHLAAGMLAVGYKGVVATMWSIGDEDAPVVVEAYYRKLLELRASGTLGKGETGAAYALHEATKILREKVKDKKFARWAPFVHFGI